MLILLKKNAEIISNASNVEIVIAIASATDLFILHFSKPCEIGLENNTIPKAQAKLIKKLISYTHNGFNIKTIIPAKPIEDNGSYSFPKRLDNAKIIYIILALTTETENPHK